MAADALIDAAGRVNAIDFAGWIRADPSRNAPRASAAEVLALAAATEVFWSVCLEAELLVRALALPPDHQGPLGTRAHAIAVQTDEIIRLMSAIRGTTQEETT